MSIKSPWSSGSKKYKCKVIKYSGKTVDFHKIKTYFIFFDKNIIQVMWKQCQIVDFSCTRIMIFLNWETGAANIYFGTAQRILLGERSGG